MSALLDAALAYPWYLIDAKTYDGAVRRFLAGCNALCIFVEENESGSEAFRLLI